MPTAAKSFTRVDSAWFAARTPLPVGPSVRAVDPAKQEEADPHPLWFFRGTALGRWQLGIGVLLLSLSTGLWFYYRNEVKRAEVEPAVFLSHTRTESNFLLGNTDDALAYPPAAKLDEVTVLQVRANTHYAAKT